MEKSRIRNLVFAGSCSLLILTSGCSLQQSNYTDIHNFDCPADYNIPTISSEFFDILYDDSINNGVFVQQFIFIPTAESDQTGITVMDYQYDDLSIKLNSDHNINNYKELLEVYGIDVESVKTTYLAVIETSKQLNEDNLSNYFDNVSDMMFKMGLIGECYGVSSIKEQNKLTKSKIKQ